MNERLIKERRRDTWLLVAGALLVVLLVAGLLLSRFQSRSVVAPDSGPAPTPPAGETAAGLLPTPIRSESLPTPVILSLTPQLDDVSMTGVAVGQIAPDFTLPTLDGETLTLSDLRGKPVVINFFGPVGAVHAGSRCRP